MLAFVLFSTVSFLALFALTYTFSEGSFIRNKIPQGTYADYEKVDWEDYKALEGYGILLNQEGEVLKSFNKEWKGKMTVSTLLEYNHFSKKESVFSYNSKNGSKLLIIFPKKYIEMTPTFMINSELSRKNPPLLVAFLGMSLVYILGSYFLMKNLANFLRKDQDRVYKEELEEKDQLFKGLAHDMKTPLSAIIGYNQAIREGLVKEDQVDLYYEKIGRSAQLLKTRLDALMNFTSLDTKENFDFISGDILEAMRRYVGENYSYYVKNQATIEILFEDQKKFTTKYNKELLNRILQNILQNSIDHSEGPVTIYLSFENKTLFIKDTGPGIPKDLWEKIFDPMVTGDPSRSGEGNRGLGLANVKRICQLHKWRVFYNEKGFQILFS